MDTEYIQAENQQKVKTEVKMKISPKRVVPEDGLIKDHSNQYIYYLLSKCSNTFTQASPLIYDGGSEIHANLKRTEAAQTFCNQTKAILQNREYRETLGPERIFEVCG